jgi:peptidoglycan-N-acetylglucosamine deacetylase
LACLRHHLGGEAALARGFHFDGQRRLSRRALLGGGATLIASTLVALSRSRSSGHPTAVARPVGTHLTPAPSAPPRSALDTTPTTEASPIPGVPITPVAIRQRPVFTVHDYLPTAPANAVALTIDDGPDLPWTPQVLAVLAEHRVKATFSLVGIHVRRQPGLLRQIVAAGHGLCNHSMTHPEPFASLPQATIDAEIEGGLRVIYAATGKVAKVFRSPGGDWSPPMFTTLARLGMTPIDWDIDPRDWARPGSSYITAKLLAAGPGDILLCHDGGGDRSQTVIALKTALPALLARGLQFVTL